MPSGGVGADAEERRVPERDLVGEAADDVPCLGHGREQQRQREHADPVSARIEEQRCEAGGDEDGDDDETPHRRAPTRP
jgi:hypothetical protein